MACVLAVATFLFGLGVGLAVSGPGPVPHQGGPSSATSSDCGEVEADRPV